MERFEMNIIINPGTGKTEDHGFEQALSNIKVFIEECSIDVELTSSIKHPSDDGRYSFLLQHKGTGKEFVIKIPALPLAEIYYTDSEKQNINIYPRLYVNGNSYVWKYALLIESDLQN